MYCDQADGAPRLYLPEGLTEAAIKLDVAAFRRARFALNPYFGTVVRDLVAGHGASAADLRHCMILAEGLVSETDIAATRAQGSLFS